MATESGGDETSGPGDETVRHVEEMAGMTGEAADDDRVRQGRDGDETGGPGSPGDETGTKTAATAGDERDGSNR